MSERTEHRLDDLGKLAADTLKQLRAGPALTVALSVYRHQVDPQNLNNLWAVFIPTIDIPSLEILAGDSVVFHVMDDRSRFSVVRDEVALFDLDDEDRREFCQEWGPICVCVDSSPFDA